MAEYIEKRNILNSKISEVANLDRQLIDKMSSPVEPTEEQQNLISNELDSMIEELDKQIVKKTLLLNE